MNINHTKMTLEINSCKNYEVLEVRQGDKKSRIIDFTFTVNGEVITLTSAMSAKVNATVDNVIVAEDVSAAIDTENNVVTVTLTDTMLALSGLCKMDIVLTEGDEIITAETVCLRIGKKVINDDSKPYEGAGSIADLAKEIKTARGTQPNLNERFVANETNLKNKANTADVETVKSEITSARGDYDNLGERLDNLLPDEVDVITTDHMRDGSVKASKIANDAITTDKIIAKAITASKLSLELLALINSIVNKADKSDVDTALATKADKATTLDGYGITDAYTKTTVKSLLADKLDAKPFDSVPTPDSPCYLTSGTVYSALAKKFDNSSIETGKGNLAPAQAIYDGYEGSFNYVKIGKIVTVALNITTLIAGKNYVQFAGLPFRAMTASKLSSFAVYTTANKLVNIRLDGSWLYVSSPGTTFADGEKINAIITYIIG